MKNDLISFWHLSDPIATYWKLKTHFTRWIFLTLSKLSCAVLLLLLCADSKEQSRACPVSSKSLILRNLVIVFSISLPCFQSVITSAMYLIWFTVQSWDLELILWLAEIYCAIYLFFFGVEIRHSPGKHWAHCRMWCSFNSEVTFGETIEQLFFNCVSLKGVNARMCLFFFFLLPFLSFLYSRKGEYAGDFHLDLFAHMLYQSLTHDVLCVSLIPCGKRFRKTVAHDISQCSGLLPFDLCNIPEQIIWIFAMCLFFFLLKRTISPCECSLLTPVCGETGTFLFL